MASNIVIHYMTPSQKQTFKVSLNLSKSNLFVAKGLMGVFRSALHVRSLKIKAMILKAKEVRSPFMIVLS